MGIPEAYDPFFLIKIDGKSLSPNLANKITKFEFEEVDDKQDMLTFVVDNQTLEFTDEEALDTGGIVSFQFGYLNRRSAPRKARIKDLEGFDEIKIQAYQINVGAVPPPKPSVKPAPAKVTSTQSQPKKYTVVKGDNLSAIAKKFGLSGWKELYEVNKGVIGGNPNLIYPGQKLTIPGKEEKVVVKEEVEESNDVADSTSNPLGVKSRVWEKMSYSDVATSIAEEMGLEADVQKTKTKYDHIPQTNEDNIEFLRRIGNKIGFTTNIYGSKLFFRHQDFGSKPQRTLYWFIDGAGEVEKFNPKIKTNGSQSAASTNGVDPTSKESTNKKSSGTNNTHLGKYSYVVDGITGEEKRILTPVSSASNNKVAGSDGDDDATAGSMANAEKKWIEAEINCIGIPEIHAGGLVTILGVGKKWSGNWYIKTVRHTIDNDGYRTSLECTRDASGKAAKISEEVDGNVNNKTDNSGSKKPGKVVIVDGITGKETIGEMP